MPGQYEIDVVGLPRSGQPIINGGVSVRKPPGVETDTPTQTVGVSPLQIVRTYSGRFRW